MIHALLERIGNGDTAIKLNIAFLHKGFEQKHLRSDLWCCAGVRRETAVPFVI